jgi:SAM-dependent methyltransferase
VDHADSKIVRHEPDDQPATRHPAQHAFDSVLEAWANDRGRLTPGDLAPVDQFHIGGAQATLELAALADLGAETRVLDIGGGFGGPARTLSSAYGCPVTVLDLTEEYRDVGEKLTERCGLQDLVSFRHGDGLAIPFPEGTFDRVWTPAFIDEYREQTAAVSRSPSRAPSGWAPGALRGQCRHC